MKKILTKKQYRTIQNEEKKCHVKCNGYIPAELNWKSGCIWCIFSLPDQKKKLRDWFWNSTYDIGQLSESWVKMMVSPKWVSQQLVPVEDKFASQVPTRSTLIHNKYQHFVYTWKRSASCIYFKKCNIFFCFFCSHLIKHCVLMTSLYFMIPNRYCIPNHEVIRTQNFLYYISSLILLLVNQARKKCFPSS